MKIYICQNYEEMSARAADLIAEQIKEKPDSVLGLATGSSPIGLYKELVMRNQKGDISFKDIKTVNLDEYCGLTADNDQSYAYFMNHNLFDHVDIDKANTNLPDGTNPDAAAECARYDALIASLGGIDIQLLGIGLNGHIGFNEPSDTISLGTNHVALTQSTFEANARFFASIDDVPRYAYSMGCGSILNAKKIMLVANGKGKAEILEKSFFGPVTSQVPASLLRLVSDKVYIFADKEAGAILLENHPEDVIVL